MPPSDPSRTKQRWRDAILSYLNDHPDRGVKPRGLARELGVAADDYADFRDLVRDMLDSGHLILGARRSLKRPQVEDQLVGTFHATDRGFGFLEVPDRDDDIYIPSSAVHGARDGDTVAAKLGKPNARTGQPRAEIVRIIDRAPLHWVGVLEQRGSDWIVVPDGPRDARPVQIDDPGAKDCAAGDLVIVEPLEHTLGHRTVRGVILKRLGEAGEAQAIIQAAIHRSGIPDEFPADVRREAQAATQVFEDGDFSDRTDLRDLLTITIDPDDARDFDDAITIETLEGGRTRLGVHIADVAHFVTPGSALDAEAVLRGNSVYFPKFVVPMLPEVLSNGVCSLQPGVERLAKSAFIDYDRKGRVVGSKFASSLIVSDKRLTYDEVTAVLENGKQAPKLDERVVKLIKQAEALAKTIRKRRIAEGMIILTLPEVELQLDDQGQPTGAGPADTSFSHTIIEMFMVEANEAVCRLMVRLGVPHLRRVHEPPDPEAVHNLIKLRPLLGRDLPDEMTRETIRSLLDVVKGRPEEPAVNMVLLRSMTQAQYSPNDEGHFALASRHYCHFTSPIRRYPDLTIHRLLDAHVAGALEVDEVADEAALRELGMQTSRTERRAQEAERDVKKALLLMLMQEKLGETFDGIVTGSISFGVFVQIHPYLAEGLVRVPDFGRDTWEYDERASTFTGVHTRRQVFLGQRVRVTVAKVDVLRQEMDLVPAEGEPFGIERKSKHRDSDDKPRRKTKKSRETKKGRSTQTGRSTKKNRSTKKGRSKRSGTRTKSSRKRR